MTERTVDPKPVPKITTIIAARPGVMRDALQAMLGLVAKIEIIGAAGGGLTAVSLIRKCPPALLIIDSGLPEDEILALLSKSKQEQPQLRCLVLTETTRQQAVMLAAGADAVLLRGEPADQIVTVLEELGL